MAAVLGWACVVCCLLVTFLSVSTVRSAQPSSANNVIGARCQYDQMCQIPNSYCRAQTQTCECKSGYTYTYNRDNCTRLPQRAYIGSHCVSNVDCAFTEEASRCAENACRRCSDGSEKEFAECTEAIGGCAYHEYDGVCFRYRKLGEPCEVSEECWIYPQSDQTRACVSAICQCEEGYDAMSGPLSDGQVDQCIKQGSGRAASSFPISSLLSLVPLLLSIVT